MDRHVSVIAWVWLRLCGTPGHFQSDASSGRYGVTGRFHPGFRTNRGMTMSTGYGKAAIIVALLLAIGGVLYLKGQRHGTTPERVRSDAPVAVTAQEPGADQPPVTTASVPDLVKPAPTTTTAPKPVPQSREKTAKTVPPQKSPTPAKATPPKPTRPAQLPRLLELGSDSCRPCQMMQPVLAALREEYPGKLQVDFIDVWKDESAGQRYGVLAIPTQIFFDASGKEIFRHVGFYPKDEILAKFKEFGISL